MGAAMADSRHTPNAMSLLEFRAKVTSETRAQDVGSPWGNDQDKVIYRNILKLFCQFALSEKYSLIRPKRAEHKVIKLNGIQSKP